MSENASSDVAEMADAVHGLTEMVRSRARRVYREADELRRLAARMEATAAALADMTDTERTRDHAR